MESNSMSLDFWPGTDIRRSTHNGFTMGLSGDQFAATVKPRAKVRTGKRGAKRPVYQLTREGEVVRQFPSLSEAAMASGAAIDNIIRAASGLRKTAGGFCWRYATNQETQ
jgi:hypothetical protein